MLRLITCLFCLALFISCNKTKEVSKNQSTDNATEQQPVANNQAQSATSLPGLPLEKLQFLFENCQHIDYLFHSLPISMSQDEKGGIQNSLRFISDTPVPDAARAKCPQSIGTVLYQHDGENVLEAEMYFGNGGCTFFTFKEGGKYIYSNYMTQDGVNFLGNMMKQVQSTVPGGANQGGQ